MDEVAQAIELPIDFEGQKLAHRLNVLIVCTYTLLSVFAGFVCQNIFYSVYVLGIGVLISSLVVIPNWPLYNKNPVLWLTVDFLNEADTKDVPEDPVAHYL